MCVCFARLLVKRDIQTVAFLLRIADGINYVSNVAKVWRGVLADEI